MTDLSPMNPQQVNRPNYNKVDSYTWQCTDNNSKDKSENN